MNLFFRELNRKTAKRAIFTRRVTRFLGLLFSCLLLAYFSTAYPYSVNPELEVNNYYTLLPICLCGFAIILVLDILVYSRLSDFRIAYIFLIALMCLFYLLRSRAMYLGNEYVIDLFCILMAGYVFLFQVRSHKLNDFIVFVNLVTILQIIKGFEQLLQAPIGYDTSLAVYGYMGNSGAYAVYLVLGLPFMVHTVARLRMGLTRRCKAIICSFVSITILVLLCITLSRTALITYALMNFHLICFYNQDALFIFIIRRKRLFALIMLASLIMVGMALNYLYFAKQRSADGRRLIWDVCMDQVQNAPFVGTGLGTFPMQYPKWQADYFSARPKVSTSYFLAAGETMTAFNEYIQIMTELGIIGLVLFVMLFIRTIKTRNNYLGKPKSFVLKIFMLATCTTAFSFYAFHCNAIAYLFTVALLMVCYNPLKSTYQLETVKIVYRFPVYFAVAFLLALCIYQAETSRRTYLNFESLCEQHMISQDEKKLIVNECYPYLETDGKFLTRLGLLLLESKDTEGSKVYLEQARVFYLGNDNAAVLADVYMQMGLKRKAVGMYQFMSNYIPNKFIPKYELFLYYRLGGYKADAKAMAKFICEMPVKIPSDRITEMRKSCGEYLELK